jgi:hypothetical protein
MPGGFLSHTTLKTATLKNQKPDATAVATGFVLP